MDALLPLLLNLFYGILFFAGFAVAVLTVGAFALAIRDTFFPRRPPAEARAD